MNALTRTTHFRCGIEGRVATLRLDRPERKNPLTFESYAELRDWFRALAGSDEVDAVVFASRGGNARSSRTKCWKFPGDDSMV